MKSTDIMDQVNGILNGDGDRVDGELEKNIADVVNLASSLAVVISGFRNTLVDSGISADVAEEMSMLLLSRMLFTAPQEFVSEEE